MKAFLATKRREEFGLSTKVGRLLVPTTGTPRVRRASSAAPVELLDRARAVQRACGAYEVPLRAAALQFPLRHAAVTQVGVGCRGAAQVDDNLAMFTVDVPEELWDELR